MDLPRLSPKVLIRFQSGDLVTFLEFVCYYEAGGLREAGSWTDPFSSSPRATETHTHTATTCSSGSHACGWGPCVAKTMGLWGGSSPHV